MAAPSSLHAGANTDSGFMDELTAAAAVLAMDTGSGLQDTNRGSNLLSRVANRSTD